MQQFMQEQRDYIAEITEKAQYSLTMSMEAFITQLKYIGEQDKNLPSVAFAILVEAIRVHLNKELEAIVKQVEEAKSTEGLLQIKSRVFNNAE